VQRFEEPRMTHELQFGQPWCVGTLFHASLKVHIYSTVLYTVLICMIQYQLLLFLSLQIIF